MNKTNHIDIQLIFEKIKIIFEKEIKTFKIFFYNFIINLLPDSLIFSRIRSSLCRFLGLKCARKVTIRKGIFYGNIKNIQIGYMSQISREVFLDASDKITIGQYVGIGYRTIIITSLHSGKDPDYRSKDLITKPVNIENGAWIGAGVVIGPGVTIGTGCIISAGSVVMNSVSPNTMVAGNPARRIKNLQEKAEDVEPSHHNLQD